MSLKKKIALFGFLAIAIHLCLSIGFNYWVSSRSNLLLTQKQFEELEEAPYFLFMGDSHTARSIAADSLPVAYNLGYYGENCIRTYYRLRYIIEVLDKKPGYVFFPSGNYRYSKMFSQFKRNNFFYIDYVDYTELTYYDHFNEDHMQLYLKHKIFPYIEWIDLLKRESEKKKNAEISWEKTSSRNKYKSARNFVRNTLFNYDQKNMDDELSLLYLSLTIELCKKHSIVPVFIKYPFTKMYFDEMDDFLGEELIKNSKSDSLIKASNCVVWNYNTIYQNNHQYFFDSHHMNQDGMNAFTKLIKIRLDSILSYKSESQ